MTKRRRRNENALPTIRVELRDPKDLNANGESSLRYVIRLKGEGKICRATGLTVKPKDWNSKKQLAIGKGVSNSRINKVIACKKADFDTYFLKVSAMDKRITMKLVAEYFNEKRFDSLFGYFDVVLKDRVESKAVGKSTIVKDNVCRKRFETFAKKKGYKNLKFVDVNLAFLQDYDRYLIREEGLQSNSANNDYKVLRPLFKRAVVDDIIDKSPFLGFKPIKTEESKKKDVLNSDDVDKLRGADFSAPEHKHLKRTRDIFLFMLNTGLRFSDVAKAKLDNIRSEKIDGTYIQFLDVVQKKTKKAVDIGLNREAKNLIHQIRIELGLKDDESLLGKMTLQPVNRNLKKVAELVGIDKRLTTHVARHSFATHLHNDLGIPLEMISGGMGHKKASMTKDYIRANNIRLATMIEELYTTKEVG